MPSVVGVGVFGGLTRRLVAALDAWSYGIAMAKVEERRRRVLAKEAAATKAAADQAKPEVTPWKD